MNNIICIVGPTATGKTALSVALCKRFGGEVLSCDSMQLYRGLNIGTAKPTAAETDGVPHRMIDCVDPNEDYSVGRYVADADAILQDILARGKTAFVVGGTGLYVDSLIAGRSFAPFPSTGKREELQALADREGIGAVLALLERFDPESAARLHPSDQKRILRAAEVYLETGKTITQHDLETRQQPPKYHPLWLGLTFRDRQDLYDRIDRRVDRMVEAGLWEEIEGLLAGGLRESCTAMQAIGYKEPLAALRGEITREEAVAQIKQSSRRYAKRQLTWFRRNPAIRWLLLDRDPDLPALTREAAELIENSP